MRVVVLGGTGEMGSLVADRLEARGHEVVRAARSTGVDVLRAEDLAVALRGADCVVDCLDLTTTSRRRAVEFFRSSASMTAVTSRIVGVPHVVVVSIVGVTEPAVSRAVGYYAGKAAQEAEYAGAGVPVTVVRSTAWFSLAETFLRQLRVGRFALVPRLHVQPVHPHAVVDLVVDVVVTGPTSGPAEVDVVTVREIAGPERTDAATMAQTVARQRHPNVRVVGLPVPLAGLRRGLLPGPHVPTDGRTLSDWLRSSDR